ncbi:MAG: AAA family ATPase [Rhodothermales bacterium]|nr:AAA family ATPase [Rhodothermales bacterium]
MDGLEWLIAGVAAGVGVWIGLFLGGRRVITPAPPSTAPVEDDPAVALYALAEGLEAFVHRSAHPRDLLTHQPFLEGVERLTVTSFDDESLLGYALGENLPISCMAFEALARRPADPSIADRLLLQLERIYLWPLFFALRALSAHVGPAGIGRLVASGQEWWTQQPQVLEFLRGWIEERLAAGEAPAFHGALDLVDDEQMDGIEAVLAALKIDRLGPMVAEARAWREVRIDRDALARIGAVWAEPPSDDTIPHDALTRLRHLALEALRQERPRSVLLVGEPGVGKSTLIRAIAGQLYAEGWTIFEAGAMEVVAGQMYIGQLEERMQELIRNLAGRRRVLWMVGNAHDLIFAGWHRDNPRSVLDMIAPYIEKGDITVIGEVEPAAYERIVQVRPHLRAGLKTVTVDPLDDAGTLALARAWCVKRNAALSDYALQEAFQMARNYLDRSAAPGHLLAFLHLALAAHAATGRTDPPAVDDMIATLSDLTGLPVSLLNDRDRLDLGALRETFEKSVLGQPEAVDCLVERVAMLKAGLCDPTRPAGVFLFVGPTGTGKTEIAKTLATFLFGAPERMIRLDMSEFMTEDSLLRLLGEAERGSDAVALVNQIRKQPFSVVLLDEFEKAHPSVWDLFLQVFDDGRLTDRRGQTADFRHAIIILTSNLGAAVPAGAGVGFGGEKRVFSAESVRRAAQQTFRPEFLNRLDRVVVFRPLSRVIARDILQKELRDVLTRRGFRSREWAVEWEESALDFLLEKGFSDELGARPLKRAIERYVLSPLALTIVNHQFPEGDQFLFIRSRGDGLDVEFIDPDQPDPEPPATRSGKSAGQKFSLEPLVLEPAGTRAEVDGLFDRYEALEDRIDSNAWVQDKAEALARTADPAFWGWEGRFEVLARVEFMDRIERAMGTADALLGRLGGDGKEDRAAYSPVLVQRLAQRLYVLEQALGQEATGRPRDAFLRIEARGAEANVFARTLAAMYVAWAEKRQMRHVVLQPLAEVPTAEGRFTLAVAGFGAYVILAREEGWHVWEAPREGKTFTRVKVRVRVEPQPLAVADTVAGLRTQADQGFLGIKASERSPADTIVRRYREAPSPLVRDSRGAWRTGRLDRVLAGDFDVMGGL